MQNSFLWYCCFGNKTTEKEFIVSIADYEQAFSETAAKLGVSLSQQASIFALLSKLKAKAPGHYLHSLRVGMLFANIADTQILPSSPALTAGALHDVGKTFIPAAVLTKTDEWTKQDTQTMREHVMLGYNYLKDRFPLEADIMVWHHRYQPNPYPDEIPPFCHEEDDRLTKHIVEYGRLLAIADSYDAMQRRNSKSDGASDDTIKQRMLADNADKRALIERLYSVGIFATKENINA